MWEGHSWPSSSPLRNNKPKRMATKNGRPTWEDRHLLPPYVFITKRMATKNGRPT